MASSYLLGGLLTGVGTGIKEASEETGKAMRERQHLMLVDRLRQAESSTENERRIEAATAANTRARETAEYTRQLEDESDAEKYTREGGAEKLAAEIRQSDAQTRYYDSRGAVNGVAGEIGGYVDTETGEASRTGTGADGMPDPRYTPVSQKTWDSTVGKLATEAAKGDDGESSSARRSSMNAEALADADVQAAAGFWSWGDGEDISGLSRAQARLLRKIEIQKALDAGQTPPPFDAKRLAGQSVQMDLQSPPDKTGAKSSAPPAGAVKTTRFSGGKPVWRLPNGKLWAEE